MAKRKNCSICGQPIKVENLEKHMKRLHPKATAEPDEKGRSDKKTISKSKRAKKREARSSGILWKLAVVAVAVIVIIAAVFLLWSTPDENHRSMSFTVVDTDGNSITTEDWTGKIILLDVMGTSSTECQNNTQNVLIPIYEAYGDKIEIFSVSVSTSDTAQDLVNYKTALGAQWPFALDIDEVKEKYEVTEIPTSFLVDADGFVVYSHIGKDSFSSISGEIDLLLQTQRYKDFTVTDTDGNTVTLSQWEGEVILLDFMQTTCGHCQLNTENTMVPIYDAYGTQIKILSLSIKGDETVQTILDFKATYGAQWQFALDTAGAKGLYGVEGTPTGFLIDRQGFIVYSHVGQEDYDALAAQIDAIL
jgi:peroxiredoxin